VNIYLGLLNVLMSFFSSNVIIHYPIWKTLGWKKRGMFIYISCLTLFIIACYFIAVSVFMYNIENLQVFKIFVSLPTLTVSFFIYRRRTVWQFLFLTALAFMYGPISTGIGIFAADTWFASVNTFLAESITTAIVAVLTLPPLLLSLKRLCNNPHMKQAVTFWRYIWLLPVFFFSVTIISSSYLSGSEQGVSFVIVRIILYCAMLLICYLLEKAIRQIGEAEATNLEKNALERVNNLKTELTRTVSHEMRTPLAVMMGFAEITAKDVRNRGIEGMAADNLDAIAAEAHRMTVMLEELSAPILIKEFSKDKRVVIPDASIRQIAGLYEKILERKNVRLILDLPEQLPAVYANEHEMTQVMFNLLRNADRHTNDGEITVSAAVTDNEITITVTDTGAGIDPELLPRVFERGTSGEKGGMGFGLSICRDIIEAHGGKIWIESESGNGTTAAFTLPVYKGENAHAE